MNQITPEIIERLGLIKTDATDGVSFVADCTFWKVGDTGIWLTDYDIEWSPEFSTREANILKREDLVFIFNRKLNTKEVMSYESLLDKYALEVIIASLKPGLTRIRPMAKKQNPYLHQPNVDNTTVPPTKIKKGMAEFQRDTYEKVIAKEWMPENAFMMAWNDFKCFPQINRSSGEYIIEIEFINWLFDENEEFII